MYCIICGQPINKKPSKYQNCGSEKCRKELEKQRQRRAFHKYKKSLENPTPERQKRIDEMKKELPDKESFAKKIVQLKNTKDMAKLYKITQGEVTKYRIELFGNMNPKEVHKLGRDLISPPKPIKALERKSILVQVYKIVDMAKFEESRKAFYEGREQPEENGLKFARVETANEILLHNKSELLEVM